MKKTSIKTLFFLAAFLMAAVPSLAQSMTDEQVVEYAQQALMQGKSKEQTAMELMQRGVTREQLERLQQQYQQGGIQIPESTLTTGNRMRSIQEPAKTDSLMTQESFYTMGMPTMNNMPTTGYDFRMAAPVTPSEEDVFGRNIFNTQNLTFEPNINVATPPNYKLGAGDEVIIDIWGTSQNSIRQTISPDGTIQVEKIGPVYLNGMSIAEANEHVKKVFSKIYAGLSTPDGGLDIALTLGKTRTIQINVMGEVMQPGTYALSNFSTLFHALYSAGGVSPIGSLRSVHLVRNGKKVAEVDIYDFIMQGKVDEDIRLQEGDVIIVPAYEALVKVEGSVKRPMRYEMKKDESLATLIKYAGGFESDAYTRSLRIIRQNGKEYEVNTVKEKDYTLYKIQNGDVITAEKILNRFTNRLEIKGAVYRPGVYQLNGEVNTVRALIEAADGVMGDAFMNRAVLQREREDLKTEIVSVDVKGILAGTTPDIALQKNDILYIPSIHDLEELGDITIHGEVAKPDSYPYSDNMTLEDLIIKAGGLKEAASVVRVDVSRRIKNNRSMEYTDSVGQTFSFALKDGFVVSGQPGFVLEPYDQVFVRRSPGYQAQQNVQVLGEVLFAGTYAMTHREERLSDMVMKAGGATPKAYLRGAKLIRVANEEEKARMRKVVEMMRHQFGAALVDSLVKVEDTFSVGIDLEKAVNNPGGEHDLVLREGDIISVPKLNNTVKINGAVMMPNTVAYMDKMSVGDYLDQAGGYALNAKKNKKFIIYMNGQVARVKSRHKSKVEPGCEIIVPSRTTKKVSFGEVLGYASSFGSLATMFATLASLMK